MRVERDRERLLALQMEKFLADYPPGLVEFPEKPNISDYILVEKRAFGLSWEWFGQEMKSQQQWRTQSPSSCKSHGTRKERKVAYIVCCVLDMRHRLI